MFNFLLRLVSQSDLITNDLHNVCFVQMFRESTPAKNEAFIRSESCGKRQENVHRKKLTLLYNTLYEIEVEVVALYSSYFHVTSSFFPVSIVM